MRFMGRPGNICLALLTAGALSMPIEALGAFGAGDFVRVKVQRANIRSGPGTRFERLWVAPRNYPYLVLSRRGKWLKVKDFEGFVEWIYSSLTDGKSAVVVRIDRANVRRGPGLRHPVLFQAEKGEPFRLLKKHATWLKVQRANGTRGWIFERLVWGGAR